MPSSRRTSTATLEARNYRRAAAGLGLAGILAIAFLVSTGAKTAQEAARLVPLRCPLLLLTGRHCPTCGLGRGLVCAARGDWRSSWNFHPCAIPCALLAAIFAISAWLAPRRLKSGASRLAACLAAHPVAVGIAIGLYSLWGFLRDLP